MKSSWTQGVTKDQAKEITQEFIASHQFRKRLRTLLEDKADASRKESRSKASYDNSNWPYLQADLMGYERALFEIISLISENNVEK